MPIVSIVDKKSNSILFQFKDLRFFLSAAFRQFDVRLPFLFACLRYNFLPRVLTVVTRVRLGVRFPGK